MDGPDDRFEGTEQSRREDGPGDGRLRDAMRRARLNQTTRSGVIVDLRETEIARLEVLADTLAPVFGELPADAEQFECSLVPSATPRLWIDMLAFVDMGRDKRTYRFVSETRAGRQVMLETLNVADMADRVTDYIAHRIIERERSLASAPRLLRAEPAASMPRGAGVEALPAPAQASAELTASWGAGVQIGLAYLAGLLTGAGGIILLALYTAG